MVTLTKAQAAVQVARLRDVRGDLAAAYGVALGQWLGDQTLLALGRPIVTCGHRSAAEQTALFAQGRQPLVVLNRLRKEAGLPAFPAGSTEAKRVVTWVTTSRHMELPSSALDVAMLQADGSVTWDAGALEKFARLVKAADERVRWGGDWDRDGDTADEKSPDRPHFEVPR